MANDIAGVTQVDQSHPSHQALPIAQSVSSRALSVSVQIINELRLQRCDLIRSFSRDRGMNEGQNVAEKKVQPGFVVFLLRQGCPKRKVKRWNVTHRNAHAVRSRFLSTPYLRPTADHASGRLLRKSPVNG